jgi:hypothetical protein
MALIKYFPDIGTTCFRNNTPSLGKILETFHLRKNPCHPFSCCIAIV